MKDHHPTYYDELCKNNLLTYLPTYLPTDLPSYLLTLFCISPWKPYFHSTSK